MVAEIDSSPSRPALNVAQQARLTSGQDFWTTKPEGGLPSIMMTDGPHGLRKQEGATDNLGISGSVAATCFPPAAGLAQSWSPQLAERVGAAIADEAQAQRVGVVLGPGINLKRSPRGGRNFEYFSEDPVLTAAMGGAWVRGLQAQGVGASLKHFAVNNQETDRMRISADVDERTLHELYLRAFRAIVIGEHPWTVMCSYNRINGVHAANNHTLLTSILREQWGFPGLVVSDWVAVVDRVASVAAGLDLTMPFAGPAPDEAVAAAVAAGTLDAAALARSAERVAALATRAESAHRPDATVDFDAHHALAREVAAQSIVLLRNDSDLLPVNPQSRIAVIGALAQTPRYQGGGSSHVNATRVDAPLEQIRARVGGDVAFAPGYRIDGTDDADTATAQADLVAEATAAARDAEVAILVLGLADAQESEGFDRPGIELPAEQLALAAQVLAANPNTVVVLCHGGVLTVAELHAPAILDCSLLGQAAGSAITDVLFGDVNPSGRLAESIPVRIEDTADYLNFPGEAGHVTYGEGLFIGYRWYDARDITVSYPFGHGLSYTTFDYSELDVATAEDHLEIGVTVTNSGTRAGREVVQVYVGAAESSVPRPIRELKGFDDIHLDAGQSGRVHIRISYADLARWDIRVGDFVTDSGRYLVDIGASSRDLRLHADVEISVAGQHIPLTLDSSVEEVLANPVAAAGMAEIVGAMFGGADSGEGVDLAAIMGSIPVGRIVDFTAGALPSEVLQGILDHANAETQTP